MKVPVAALPCVDHPLCGEIGHAVHELTQVSSTLPAPSRPETVPVSGGFGVIVTLLVAALKLVMMFPEASLAVSVLVPVKPTPSVWELAALKVKLARRRG